MGEFMKRRMPTPALKIMTIGLISFIVAAPFFLNFIGSLQSVPLVLISLIIGCINIFIPVMGSLAFHYFTSKTLILKLEICICAMIPLLSFLPMMVVAHREIFGLYDYRGNITASMIFVFALALIYLNTSIIFRTSENRIQNSIVGALPYFALLGSALINLFMPWWPLD